ncbi:MAG TPA: flagellar motor protein MotB [Pseudolabrys sp.]|nr:flagellar motor protein MotB [Pseudolabrys sp.]
MAKKRGGHTGGHGWFVTFADLMALLMAFFVMLVAFSTQDQQKMQVVAGSMREAFGVQDKTRYSGIIEIPGLPTRPRLKNAANISPDEASPMPSDDEKDHNRAYGARFKEDQKFALAAASLRQALQDMPEITEASKNVMLEETRDGLNIQIIDQDGRAMFAEGSRVPNERTRRLIARMAPALKAMPYRLTITGHTATVRMPQPDYAPWDLSADRANAIRQILQSEGVRSGNIFMVAGKADTEPLFPDNPTLSSNRRVTITLMREEPPIPPNFKP